MFSFLRGRLRTAYERGYMSFEEMRFHSFEVGFGLDEGVWV